MDDKEQLKRELNIIIGVSEKYDLRNVSNVKKLRTYYETKVELKTSIGKKYLNRLCELEDGADICLCIICKTNIAADGVICPTCMEKLSHGKRFIYSQRENSEASTVNDKRKEKPTCIIKKPNDGKWYLVLFKKAAMIALNIILLASAFLLGKNYGEGRFESFTQRLFRRSLNEDSQNIENIDAYSGEDIQQEQFTDEKSENEGYDKETYNKVLAQSSDEDFGEENYDFDDYAQVDYDPYDYGEENYDAEDYAAEQHENAKKTSLADEPLAIYPGVKSIDFSMLDISDKTTESVDEADVQEILYQMYPQSDGWLVEYKGTMKLLKMNFWVPIGYETSLASLCLMNAADQKWFEIGKEEENVYAYNVINYDAHKFVYPFANSAGRILAYGNIVDENYYSDTFRIR